MCSELATCLLRRLRLCGIKPNHLVLLLLQPVFDLLLWSVQLVQEYQAPMFELAVSVLQTISQASC